MRILIIKLSAIGDVVHSLAFLNAIKNTYPHAHVSWIVSEKAYQLLYGHEYISNLYLFKRTTPNFSLSNSTNWYHYIKDFLRLVNHIRTIEYDYVVDLQGLFKSSIFVLFARSREKLGFNNAREFSYLPLTKRIDVPDMDIHAVDRYLLVAKHLSAKINEIKFPITVSKDDEKRLNDLLWRFDLLGKKIVGIIPGSGWKSKLWTVDGFVKLIRLLGKNGFITVIVGSNSDKWLAKQIMMEVNDEVCYDLTGLTDLKVLYLLFKKMQLVVSTDTGPMHLADASGVPVVSLFGPTAPWRTGPYNNLKNVVRLGVSCSPCFKRECKDQVCMKDITAEMVFEKVEGILK